MHVQLRLLNCDLPEVRVSEQRFKLPGLTQREGGRVGGNAGTGQHRPVQVVIQRVASYGLRHQQQRPSTRYQHPAKFCTGQGTVWEELKALLAQHHVKRRLCKRQGQSAALNPFDVGRSRCCRMGAGHRQHRRVDIQRCDLPMSAHPPRRLTGHDARTAGQVQHTLAGAQGGVVQQHPRTGPEHAGHQIVVVRLSRTQRRLLRRRHNLFPG